MRDKPDESSATDFGAIVVGAGFGGLRMLHELRERGITAKVLEEGSDVGGTWYWNRYPGARTDSESWAYCFSFSPEFCQEWDWVERYSAQPEVLSYLRAVTDRFDLRKDIQFDTEVAAAAYSASDNRWLVTTTSGEEFTCIYFIAASGPLSRPLAPPFRGLASFEGDWYLTAKWPDQEVDFTGKRVGIIGTGATGIQVLPVVAEQAAHVTVFQRTPNYVVPARNRKLTDDERDAIKGRYDAIWALTRRQMSGFPIEEATRTFDEASPEEHDQILEHAWQVGGFEFLFGAFSDLLVNKAANDAASEFIRTQIRSIVKDPATAELLCPKGYPFGAKRPPLGHFYYEAYNRDNVTLVDVSSYEIECITPAGIRTGAGEFEFDVLIFATGFDSSTGALMAMDIQGRNGRSLQEKWALGPRTHLGLTVDEFPNMFMISGPQSPFGNIPVVVENAVSWIGAAISHAQSTGIGAIEPSGEAVASWVREIDRMFGKSPVRFGNAANSWLIGANVEGKAHAPLFYFGRANVYFDRLRDIADADFSDLAGQHG